MSGPAIDSAWHPLANPTAMQWWFFTLFGDDGTVLRCRLWLRGRPSSGHMRCGVEISGYPPTGPAWDLSETFGAEQFYAEQERVFVMIGPSRFERRGSEALLDLRVGGLELRMRGWPTVQAGEPGLRQPVNSEHGFRWTVPILDGRFEATWRRRAGQPARTLVGRLFHDHVLADAAPSWDFVRNYRGWCWGVAYPDDRALLFVQVDFVRAPVNIVFVAERGGPVRVLRAPHNRLPLRCDLDREPRFWLLDDSGEALAEAALRRVERKRHMIVDGPMVEALINALPGMRKLHGVGTLAGGPFYYELLYYR